MWSFQPISWMSSGMWEALSWLLSFAWYLALSFAVAEIGLLLWKRIGATFKSSGDKRIIRVNGKMMFNRRRYSRDGGE